MEETKNELLKMVPILTREVCDETPDQSKMLNDKQVFSVVWLVGLLITLSIEVLL